MSNQHATDQHGAGPDPAGAARSGWRRPLRRRQEGRLVAGVAAGVADHLGIDVVIVRILFVLTTVFTNGLGLVAYLLGWVFIPSDEGAPARPARTAEGGLRRDPLFWVGIGLLIVGAVWLFNVPFGPRVWFPFGPAPMRFDGGLVFALLLIGLGVALWRAGDRRPDVTRQPAGRPSGPPPSATAATPPTTVPAQPAPTLETAVSRDPLTPEATVREEGTREESTPTEELPPSSGPGPRAGAGGPAGPPAGHEPPSGPPPSDAGGQAAAWTPPPVPERQRSVLGQITLGLALVTAGVLWALRVSGAVPLGIGRIAAAALLVVGLGLLVGGFAGRARWLILVGILILPLVLVAELLRPIGFADLPSDMLRGPYGEIRTQPATIDELEPSYQIGAGALHLDLTELVLEDDTRVSVQVGAGEVRVHLPEDVNVEVVARSGAGETRVLGRSATGVGIERRVVDEVDDPVATLDLDIQVGLGAISVTRAPAPSGAGVFTPLPLARAA